MSSIVSYGWGVIPVSVRIEETDFTTSLFPKDGGYLVPIKDAVRKAEGLGLGEAVLVEMASVPDRLSVVSLEDQQSRRPESLHQQPYAEGQLHRRMRRVASADHAETGCDRDEAQVIDLGLVVPGKANP